MLTLAIVAIASVAIVAIIVIAYRHEKREDDQIFKPDLWETGRYDRE